MESKPKKAKRNIPIDIDLYRKFKKTCDEKDLFVKRECQRLLKAYIDKCEKETKRSVLAVNE